MARSWDDLWETFDVLAREGLSSGWGVESPPFLVAVEVSWFGRVNASLIEMKICTSDALSKRILVPRDSMQLEYGSFETDCTCRRAGQKNRGPEKHSERWKSQDSVAVSTKDVILSWIWQSSHDLRKEKSSFNFPKFASSPRRSARTSTGCPPCFMKKLPWLRGSLLRSVWFGHHCAYHSSIAAYQQKESIDLAAKRRRTRWLKKNAPDIQAQAWSYTPRSHSAFLHARSSDLST